MDDFNEKRGRLIDLQKDLSRHERGIPMVMGAGMGMGGGAPEGGRCTLFCSVLCWYVAFWCQYGVLNGTAAHNVHTRSTMMFVDLID